MKTIAIGLCLALFLPLGTASAQNLTTGHTERLDMDDDGAVEGSEFEAFMGAAFAHLDANKDGSLEASETSKLLSPAQVTDLDANGDGMVSQAEFATQGREDFRAADKDGDGRLN